MRKIFSSYPKKKNEEDENDENPKISFNKLIQNGYSEKLNNLPSSLSL